MDSGQLRQVSSIARKAGGGKAEQRLEFSSCLKYEEF
jgi:hypothetical protein